MTDANKNLVLRIVSAAVLLPVVLVLLWLGPAATAALIAAASGVLAFEFYSITLKKLEVGQVVGILAAAAIPLGIGFLPERFPTVFLAGAAGLLIALFVIYLLAGPLPEAPVRVSLVFTGVVYSGLLLGALAALRAQNHGLQWIFVALIATWANDTGAYAAGRTLGRHKLYPAVSPGKTWEGFFGGMVAATAGLFIAKFTFFPELTAADCLLIGLPTSLLGPAGDLSESMLKRAYGAKDSGKIMPGHGGLLDRVDALLFNGPYVLLYALLVGR